MEKQNEQFYFSPPPLLIRNKH